MKEGEKLNERGFTWWEGYQWPDDLTWWRWRYDIDSHGEAWFSLAGEDGRECCSIPLRGGWHRCDVRMIGQLVKMYAKRRIAWHYTGVCRDEFIAQSGRKEGEWLEVLNEPTEDEV